VMGARRSHLLFASRRTAMAPLPRSPELMRNDNWINNSPCLDPLKRHASAGRHQDARGIVVSVVVVVMSGVVCD
jgi:hypothetical protein